jgi:phage-related protein (TIGR01555 family)
MTARDDMAGYMRTWRKKRKREREEAEQANRNRKIIAINEKVTDPPAPRLVVNNPDPLPKRRIPYNVLDQSRVRKGEFENPFYIRPHPPGVKAPNLAQDSSVSSAMAFASSDLNQAVLIGSFPQTSGSLVWPGFATLAYWAIIPEVMNACTTFADEMCRKWIKLTNRGTEDKADKIKELEQSIEAFKLRDTIHQVALYDAMLGRSHVFLELGNSLRDREELIFDIGDGSSQISKLKCKQGSLKAIRFLDPYWVYPTWYNSTDPLADGYYTPDCWIAMSAQVHKSRLLTFVSVPVPTILLPAYQFSGLSLTARMMETTQYWRRNRRSISNLLNYFVTPVLKTDLSTQITEGDETLFQRAELFANLRDNRSLLMLNKDSEEFDNVSAPLAGLDQLQAQSLEHIATIAKIPLTKYAGLQPAGLNASSQGELEVWYANVHALQESFLTPNLTKILRFMQLNLWGEVDEDIGFEWVPLWTLTAKEEAEVELLKAQSSQIHVDTGAIGPEEYREVLAADPSSEYENIDVERDPNLSNAEAEEMLRTGPERSWEDEDEHELPQRPRSETQRPGENENSEHAGNGREDMGVPEE